MPKIPMPWYGLRSVNGTYHLNEEEAKKKPELIWFIFVALDWLHSVMVVAAGLVNVTQCLFANVRTFVCQMNLQFKSFNRGHLQ